LLLLPVHNHSVFSMLSLRRFADIQWLIAVTQRSRAARERVNGIMTLRKHQSEREPKLSPTDLLPDSSDIAATSLLDPN